MSKLSFTPPHHDTVEIYSKKSRLDFKSNSKYNFMYNLKSKLKAKLRLFILSLFSLVFIACGSGGSGGSSSGGTNPNAKADASGTAQLGYIQNGDVKLFELSNLNKTIAQTKSSSSSDIKEAGKFTFKNLVLDNDKYYLIEISGGKDIDPNDDGEIKANEAVDLKGSVYALAKGEDLKSGDVRINALSDMAYQKLKGSISTLTTSDIHIELAKNAKEYLYDINGDGKVNHKNILAFDPTKHTAKTKKSYRDILDIYVPKLHNGESDDKKLASLMYLDKPRIVIKNGALQEIPFKLEISIENVPKSTSIKWFLNNVNKSSINETITNDGIYSVIAKIYKNDKLLKTISSQVI